MINIEQALRSNLRFALYADPTYPHVLRGAIRYGASLLCECDVELPTPSLPSMADERRRDEADAIAEARRIADSQGRALAQATLDTEDARRLIGAALEIGPGPWSWRSLADTILAQRVEMRALKAEVIRLKAILATTGAFPTIRREGGP